MKYILLLLLVITTLGSSYAQAPITNELVQMVIEDEDQIKASDLLEARITHEYTTKEGIRYTYIQQYRDDVPIYHANAVVVIKDDHVVVNSRLISGLMELQTSSMKQLGAQDAIQFAYRHDGGVQQLELTKSNKRMKDQGRSIYYANGLTQEGAAVRLMYVLKEEQLVLTWEVDFMKSDGQDFWSMRLDAQSGEVVNKTSLTTHCQLGHSHVGRRTDHRHCAHNTINQATTGDGASYHVFPLPIESPIYGNRSVIVDPADDVASPYGWHDDNGSPGHEYITTEGNNVNAYLDRDGNGVPDRDVSGGTDLIFDFPYDGVLEPDSYEDAATSNLFYMNNMMHDIAYAYGFDEVAGNFQQNNYNEPGQGSDPVIALAQYDGENLTNINNATFSTLDDGLNGVMRMYLWDRRDDISIFEVVSPAEVAGAYPALQASFGGDITSTPLQAEVALANDGIGRTSDACETINNDLSGKIAMIDRGNCEFGFKILNAENRGAVAAIICNNVAGNVNMGAGDVGNQVTIPALSLEKESCSVIREYIEEGLVVKFQIPGNTSGPTLVDGSFDNGIIAHEYAHGISNRLTGGPDDTDCLNNVLISGDEEGEQMGEGWSDFFSLIVTVQPGDMGEDPRGIGNYVLRLPLDGDGIRAYPYSTDMSINPVTYYSTFDASVPHGVGHVWCSMIWDMYWAFVDRYGWDPDVIHGTGGNNMAIKLVMEGMKIQPCQPGFVDGRDAILTADEMLHGGNNLDIIWKVFARRGLGLHAQQGDPDLIGDAIEDYAIPAEFDKRVRIEKRMTPRINKGEDIEVVLTITNGLDDAVTNLEIMDEIPDESAVRMSSLPDGAEVNGDVLLLNVTELATQESLEVRYSLKTPMIPSIIKEVDDFDDNEANFRWFSIPLPGSNEVFRRSNVDPIQGSHSWEVRNPGNDQYIGLTSAIPFFPSGDRPMIRFTHQYSLEPGSDGGIFQVSNDQTVSWSTMREEIVREGYNSQMVANSFFGLEKRAFSAGSDGVVDTYIDMAAFKDQEIYIQWVFNSDDDVRSQIWQIDDLMLIDAQVYNGEVCLSWDGIAQIYYAPKPVNMVPL